ncbi:aspartyl/asparaginyl beta-hydroxylase isoform X2 [Aricia agestis]|uniref:aspartyl/asparaginyl beta-hydroxylase isoform X2 n=1 Tax=Aricia agestis TaxID=91739 RepID=UPI001C208DEA|nr:aspartyl/asparaginyl beta-hydroxylase isoform X2 [Aricia agestis]
MSGDVQPRKRKDKKKKKEELSIEEPRGTAAALGEGDVFMHSQHDHGTGGHWCAKIIFFSLLAVLITLIGLIILENRGLSELEANSVESRYSGVLEGWIEDTIDDDHHDEHTLELKHPAYSTNQKEDELGNDEESAEEHDVDEDDTENHGLDHENDDDLNDDDDDLNDDDDDHDDDNEIDEDNEDDDDGNDEENEREVGENYLDHKEDEIDNDDTDGLDDDQDDDEEVDNPYDGEEEDKYTNNFNSNEEEDEHEDEDEKDDDEEDIEVEKIEREITDDAILSAEATLDRDSPEDNVEDKSKEEEDEPKADESGEDDDFLEAIDDGDEPPVEIINAPSGAAFDEIEEETVIVKPPDTLADEEEYEKRQEELRKEVDESSHMWLKLVVGGALLVATHAVLRRCAAPRDEAEEENDTEEPLLVDRRMTLVPQHLDDQETEDTEESALPEKEIIEEVVQKIKNIDVAAPKKIVPKEEPKPVVKEEPPKQVEKDKELYSDEDEIEEDEEIEQSKETNVIKDEEVEPDDDVEIVDEEIDEEIEEEDIEEEEISDVDDAELLSRLDAKYGRLPEPHRPGQKDGGNSVDHLWPGEPSEAHWRQELDRAEEELRQGAWQSCERRVGVAALANSARARWLTARALDMGAEKKRDNTLLSRAINAYLHLLKMNEGFSNKRLKEIALRTIDRMQFGGKYLSAEPVYRLLIRRFPNVVGYRNNLTISFLMANRADLAEEVLKETLKLWPDDRLALAHHGFVMKNQHNKLEEAVVALQKALEGDTGPANEPRFYYHLGDALMLLGRVDEAHEVHKRGAKHGHFLSPSQRSLYNVPRLKSRPWWRVEDTPYANIARALEKSWREILKEGEAAKELYEKEKEGLKERGDWTQMDLFVRGREIPGRCARAPVTCSIARAAACRRGQVKFSLMAAGTHVRAHVGPTNCRLRMHLGLSNTRNTFIRVDNETKQWEVGKVLMFDDSFEHKVWHNGTGARLVLIVDVWHPDLTPQERRQLPAI